MIVRTTLLAVCGFALLAGCTPAAPEKPKTFTVTGTVMLKGKALEDARVIFVPTQGGAPASGITDKEGKYQLTTNTAGDGAQAGTYGVKVTKYEGKAPAAPAKNITYEEEQNLPDSSDAKPAPPPKNVLPKKYENEGTSKLTHTVSDGPSTFDIKID